MKRFIRTTAGKTILFILCIFSAFLLTGSVLGICMFFESDAYVTPKEDMIRNCLYDPVYSEGYNVAEDTYWACYYDPNAALPLVLPDHGNYYYAVLNEEGRMVAVSEFVNAKLAKGTPLDKIDWMQNTQEIEIHPPGLEYSDTPYLCYTVYSGVNMAFPTADHYAMQARLISFAYNLRYIIYFIAGISLLTLIGSFVALMASASRRPDTEELCPGPLNVIPFDVLTVVMLAIGSAGFAVLDARVFSSVLTIILIIALSLNIASLLLGYCISIASRLKQRNLLSNTLTFRILKLLWRILKWFGRGLRKLFDLNLEILRGIPIIWKTVIITFAVSLLEFLCLAMNAYEPDIQFTLFIIEKTIVIPLILLVAINLRKLEKGGKAMASGDIDHHTDTSFLLPSFKAHAENLNNVSDSIALAVNERMKSEHMKTELITNVSHDIKTPLTSIINYADLIGREDCDNPKIREYTEVLTRQSTRLKRLIEDLVEASKASTGNLEVDLQPCDAAVFLSQADGEYEEKLQKADLTLITSQPENEVRIQADGRRMWRIFDNLMNNICKYAQPGTRVYLSLEEKDSRAVITFRNTSREQLNMSEEELMERFTRGDSSRNTEGNGLGLSIARSMAELQNGSLNIVIDGDLFKAVLEFPVWG